MKTLIATALTAAALALPVMAQDTARPQLTADEAISALQLTDVTRRGNDLSGTLPGGQIVELDFDRNGHLEEIEARNPRLIPISAVAAILPETLRNAERFPIDGEFEKIDFDHDSTEIEGRDAQNRPFEADYDTAGNLLKWELD
ncbi:MAG: hypothetical protein Q4G14_13085 [Paracoccus sp. (in: a-proteobacteria)]|uniref:hypothetical protein n=1 Tax=Paracoccus sp. TaxID=267 RepID=UPI0026DEE0A8|nr:hypothetical protein [Paracoccus sp. (in: a-proteobacteria)]MDO5614157.1 hypothetical protein [Paracoccus sp. (in: a-proteobacteria)]